MTSLPLTAAKSPHCQTRIRGISVAGQLLPWTGFGESAYNQLVKEQAALGRVYINRFPSGRRVIIFSLKVEHSTVYTIQFTYLPFQFFHL